MGALPRKGWYPGYSITSRRTLTKRGWEWCVGGGVGVGARGVGDREGSATHHVATPHLVRDPDLGSSEHVAVHLAVPHSLCMHVRAFYRQGTSLYHKARLTL